MTDECAALIDEVIALRKEAGLTQQELAEATGLSQPVIARLEGKKIAPTITTITKVSAALGGRLTVVKR